MTYDQNDPYTALDAFDRGSPIRVPADFVRWSLRRHKIRCASRRAYVIIVADWLIRLSKDSNGWLAKKLNASPDVAERLDHEHALTPDAHDQDVLLCRACGMEW